MTKENEKIWWEQDRKKTDGGAFWDTRNQPAITIHLNFPGHQHFLQSRFNSCIDLQPLHKISSGSLLMCGEHRNDHKLQLVFSLVWASL